MAILTTQLPEIAFPFELDTLVFEAEEGDELSTRILIEYDYEAIIDEELYFDSDGKILIEDLASLLIDYIRDTSEAYTFSVTVGRNMSSCFLVACTVDLEKPAMQVLDESFMTPLIGPKTTYLNGEEFLTMYSSNGDVDWSVKADFISDDTLFSWDENFTAVFDTTAVFARLRVSPSEIMKIFSQAEGKLLGYTVIAGKREQRYIVKQQNATEVVHFLNSFLEEDTFYFAHIEREVKPTRTMVTIKGQHKVVYVDPSAKFKATSYPLMDSELPLAEDLVCAKDVWQKGDMIAIIENDFKYSTDSAELPRLSVTWQPPAKRLAHKNHNLPRTFDKSFDETYA